MSNIFSKEFERIKSRQQKKYDKEIKQEHLTKIKQEKYKHKKIRENFFYMSRLKQKGEEEIYIFITKHCMIRKDFLAEIEKVKGFTVFISTILLFLFSQTATKGKKTHRELILKLLISNKQGDVFLVLNINPVLEKPHFLALTLIFFPL